jgi:hypothetical protein
MRDENTYNKPRHHGASEKAVHSTVPANLVNARLCEECLSLSGNIHIVCLRLGALGD